MGDVVNIKPGKAESKFETQLAMFQRGDGKGLDLACVCSGGPVKFDFVTEIIEDIVKISEIICPKCKKSISVNQGVIFKI